MDIKVIANTLLMHTKKINSILKRDLIWTVNDNSTVKASVDYNDIKSLIDILFNEEYLDYDTYSISTHIGQDEINESYYIFCMIIINEEKIGNELRSLFK